MPLKKDSLLSDVASLRAEEKEIWTTVMNANGSPGHRKGGAPEHEAPRVAVGSEERKKL